MSVHDEYFGSSPICLIFLHLHNFAVIMSEINPTDCQCKSITESRLASFPESGFYEVVGESLDSER